MGRSRISTEEFVCLWMRNVSVADIAARTGTTMDAVRWRASYLRRQGVRLPRRAGLDVTALNAIVRQEKQRWRT